MVSCSVNGDIKPKRKADADFVLRNLPVIKKKKKEEKEEKPAKGKVVQNIEAIFEGM
jgi:hypothetical protein